MATVQDIISKAYTKVNGEFETVVPGSDDFNTYLNVLNQVMETWARWPYVKWQSLFNMNYRLPDVVADGQLIYPVAEADTIHVGNTPFDGVYFVDDDGVTLAKYKLTDQAFFDSSNLTNIAVLVSDGLHLKAVDDNLVGASIRLPVYVNPPVYTTATQTVRIDSVPWLVAYMAAFVCDASPVPFIARNADKFYKQADIFMKTMRDNNRHRQHLTTKRMADANSNQPISFSDMIDLVAIDGIGSGGSTGSGTIVIDGGSA